MPSGQNLLVIIGYGRRDQGLSPDFGCLTEALSEHLAIPVQPAFLDSSPLDKSALSVGEAIQIAVAEHQPNQIVVLPLFTGASAARKNNVELMLDAAADRWPNILIRYGKPIGTHSGVIAAYRDLITSTLQGVTQAVSPSEIALLVIGRGSRDPESNADGYQMARLLWEGHQFGSLEIAFHGSVTRPDISEGIKRCIQSGARQIIAVPYVLYEEAFYTAIQMQLQQSRLLYPDIEMIIAPHIGVHSAMSDAIGQRYQEAVIALPPQIAPANLSNSADPLKAMLPPRYQGETSISAAPMGGADLIYDETGQIAWDEIWGDFCNLALAGGPPHRGTFLEPPSPESTAADPEAYQRVLAELTRGIWLVTKLEVVSSRSPGWIGIRCTDEDMALWLLRAIVVENVSVRREGTLLFLPAGPDYRLDKEIKNVVTVIAKTHHYWTEHIMSRQR